MLEATIRVLEPTRNRLAAFLLAACCLVLMSSRAAARGFDFGENPCTAQAQKCSSGIAESQFAIGDFDGDRQPDLATVEIARFNPLHSRYSVSFQLSQGRAQTIGVTGPAGGLVLVARDVNGDRALDLVLVTAWRHEMVAVLLNDGEGNFAAVDAAQFQFTAVSSASQFRIARTKADDRTALAVTYSFAKDFDRDKWAGPSQESGPAFPQSLEHASSFSKSAIFGRAPPPPVLHNA